jgi:hypothetical protein
MRAFLDLPGASGASYRFRLWPEGQSHVPIAGNFVLVREREEGGDVEVLVIGVTNDLSRARASLDKAQRQGATHAYTRLNVARTLRQTEHEDLVAQHSSAKVVTEDR